MVRIDVYSKVGISLRRSIYNTEMKMSTSFTRSLFDTLNGV